MYSIEMYFRDKWLLVDFYDELLNALHSAMRRGGKWRILKNGKRVAFSI